MGTILVVVSIVSLVEDLDSGSLTFHLDDFDIAVSGRTPVVVEEDDTITLHVCCKQPQTNYTTSVTFYTSAPFILLKVSNKTTL